MILSPSDIMATGGKSSKVIPSYFNMAHVRKDTLVSPPEWWKHLRPWNKRRVAKAERRAAVREIQHLSQESASATSEAKLNNQSA